MKADAILRVRSASQTDWKQIASLVHFESRVHRHLDWRNPLDWLGRLPYLVAERGERVVAVLACPPDPPGIAWIRLFANADNVSPQESWLLLWEVAHAELSKKGSFVVAGIALQQWVKSIFESSGFSNRQDVLSLEWSERPTPAVALHDSARIRPMRQADLKQIVEIDRAAFNPLWQNSLEALQSAYVQAGLATVAESEHGIIAYQISTLNPVGGHLARLAVQPEAQGQGIGTSLVAHVLQSFVNRGLCRMTVNTQRDNTSSLALYRKLGFKETSEHYPVYEFQV